MRRVYLAQINTGFGDSAFLPYSAGLLWARAAADPRVTMEYTLSGLLCQRLPLAQTMGMIDQPDLLALSCYIWNWNYSMQLAREVKTLWPGCMVVIGGPEVPNRSDGFLETHPHVDILVHGEGEEAFHEILLARLGVIEADGIQGISLRGPDGSTLRTPPRRRSDDIDSIPSPYVSGVFDDLMYANPEISWHASQETHRGCPYSCTFCDWGSAVYTKIREFGDQRLLDEMAWFSDRRIDLLYNCDANYGILRRDIDLTARLVDGRLRTGYPRKFRASYAKKSDGKVFEISRMLNDAGMSKGVTLSLQSLDATTLDTTKRSNISMERFGDLVDLYRRHGIPTYTEIILGLPGETLGSFEHGLERLLESGQHEGINVYPCMLLRNSEMAEEPYRRQHGLESVRIPIGSNHGKTGISGIEEYQDVIVSTNSMGAEDWKRAYMLSWMVQCLHCLGLTQLLAMYHRLRNGCYMGFYSMLLERFTGKDTVLGREIATMLHILDGVLSGSRGFDGSDARFGDVMWPPEEISFLRIAASRDEFYDELYGIAVDMAGAELGGELLGFQRMLVTDHRWESSVTLCTRHDIMGFYLASMAGNSREPMVQACITRFTSDRYFHGDMPAYARELVWYGRKQGLIRAKIERLQAHDYLDNEDH